MSALPESVDWRPWPGQQTKFLSSPAFEAFYGGQAGPGKTECLVLDALRQIDHPKYTSRFFRRIYPSLEGANGPIQRSLEWYPYYGGLFNASKHMWRFPSGARIYFSAMQYEEDKFQFQGDELTTAYFDELPEFTPSQYLYIFTRVRASAPGLRPYIRSAGNPGGIGRVFVRERFIRRDIRNRLRYFAQIDGKDTEVSRDYPNALSRAFYPATLEDNPAADPDYAKRIMATGDPILIAQLLHGDFDIEYTEGQIYDTWTASNISADIAVYNPDLPVYWGVDDGYAHGHGPGYADYHPRVILWAQTNALGGLNVIDELCVTGETYGETFEKALDPARYPYRRPSLTWIDGSAATFRAEFDARGLTTANGTHKVVEGIKATREMILGGDGVRRLLVNPKCANLIYEMPLYRSDAKARSETGELVPMKVNDHSEDALRYLLYHKRGGN